MTRAPRDIHESFLLFAKFRYLKAGLALVAASLLAYALHRPYGPPYGGTWLGYTLGCVSGMIVVWLSWFGIKKRSYGKGRLSEREWLSAHIYLGLSLIVVATLHTGIRFGYNVHTLLYLLMMIVVCSGLVGVYFYLRYPPMLTANRRGLSTEIMLSQIAELDREIRTLAMDLDDTTNRLVLAASRDAAVGGSIFQQLGAFDTRCHTTLAREYVEQSAMDSTPEQDTRRRQLLARLVRKEDCLMSIRRDIQLRSLLRVWLFVHVPFSFATLAALCVHVVTEFYYW